MNVHTSCACFSLLTLKEVQLRCGYLRMQTGGPLTPRGLSSLWRQPAPFAFIPTFSADAATLKTHQPDNGGGSKLPQGCMGTQAVLQGQGPRKNWDAACACSAGPPPSAAQQALSLPAGTAGPRHCAKLEVRGMENKVKHF